MFSVKSKEVVVVDNIASPACGSIGPKKQIAMNISSISNHVDRIREGKSGKQLVKTRKAANFYLLSSEAKFTLGLAVTKLLYHRKISTKLQVSRFFNIWRLKSEGCKYLNLADEIKDKTESRVNKLNSTKIRHLDSTLDRMVTSGLFFKMFV